MKGTGEARGGQNRGKIRNISLLRLDSMCMIFLMFCQYQNEVNWFLFLSNLAGTESARSMSEWQKEETSWSLQSSYLVCRMSHTTMVLTSGLTQPPYPYIPRPGNNLHNDLRSVGIFL